MLAEFFTENISKKTEDFICSEGVNWDVLPGMQTHERKFKKLNAFVRFMQQCEKVEGRALAFEIQPTEKLKENDDEMVTVLVKPARFPFEH